VGPTVWLIPTGYRATSAPMRQSHEVASPVRATGFIEPCLPSQPPSGPDWLHEVKFDGYRAMIRCDGAGRAADALSAEEFHG
jgi:bifunctional non-homologous end joining protein LigD